jgi:PAS domain S-box-containing protein
VSEADGDPDGMRIGTDEPHAAPLAASFTDLLGTLPDGALVTTSDGRIVAVNDTLCVLTGYAESELVDAHVELLVPGPFRAQHVALRAEYVATGGGKRAMSSRLDIVLRCADGTETPVDIALTTIPNGDDRLVVATVRDASVRRRAEMSVERERAFLGAMNEVSNALLEAGDIEVTLDLVTRRARALLDADLAMLVLPDRDETSLLVVHVADGLAARELRGSTLPVDHSMSGLAMREREPALIDDGGKDPRLFRPPGWPEDIGPTLIVPLHSRGETLGSITIAKRRGRPMFLASDVIFITTFATHATLAISEARHQEERRFLRTLAERDQLAGSMSDTVIHRLHSVGLTLHVMLQHEIPADLVDRVWNAIEEIDDTVVAVRNAIYPR